MASKRQRPKGTGSLFKREPKGPWIARWYDHNGRRRERSTKTTDRAAAERILAKHITDAALRRDGVIDVAKDAYLEYGRTPLLVHLTDYDEHLRVHVNRKTGFASTEEHRANRRRQLARVAADLGWTRLEDLERGALEHWLARQGDAGMSARTRNTYALSWSAFANWCIDTGRLAINPFQRLGKANERADCRRRRRALATDELQRLIDAASRRPIAELGRTTMRVEPPERGAPKRASWTYVPITPENIDACEQTARDRLREQPERLAVLIAQGRRRALVYKLLVLTGLRVNELRSLRVRDVDLHSAAPFANLAAANEKARRGAEIPLRDDLVADLVAHLAKRGARPDDRLVQIPRDALRGLHLDLVAAGLARRVQQRSEAGETKWMIEKVDERGRTFDLHAFRTTFNSLLAAAGVPLTTRRLLMRHAASGVTDAHYADAKLIDLRGALDVLPALPLNCGDDRNTQRATGTDGAIAGSGVREISPRLFPRQLERESAPQGTARCDESARVDRDQFVHKSGSVEKMSGGMRRRAKKSETAGDRGRTGNNQLGRLVLYQLSYARTVFTTIRFTTIRFTTIRFTVIRRTCRPDELAASLPSNADSSPASDATSATPAAAC